MSFVKLQFRPGVFRDGTRYSAEGTWYDCDKVRFRKGLPEKIGGWEKYSTSNFLGVARKLFDWGTIGGSKYVSVGTTLKLYIETGSAFYDITPLRTTVTLGSNPFTTTASTGVITVTHTAHGATQGDFVTYSGTTGPIDGIPASDFNQEHRVDRIIDANTYEILVDTAASAGSVSGGGTAVVAAYQIGVGLDTFVTASGWGSGSWGAGSWGGGSSLSATSQLRLWSMDNYGDDLTACVRQGGVYYWDQSDGTGVRAIKLEDLIRRTVTLGTDPITTVAAASPTVTITDIAEHGAGVGDKVTITGVSGTIDGIPDTDFNGIEHTITAVPTTTTFQIDVATNATAGSVSGGGSAVQAVYNAGVYNTPSVGLQVMTSPVARHVIVFGTNAVGDTTLDPMLVRWCASENAAEWEPREDNSAGGQRLSVGSNFVGAVRTRQEIVIWTDTGMTSMRYSGTPFIFSFSQVASNVSMISPNAAVNANGVVFFMDRGGFYVYSGAVRRLRCPVRDYIFSDIDLTQANKVFAGTNVDLSEVIWFYPCGDGDGSIDKYVLFNYDEEAWSYGTMARGHWSESPTKTYPLASSILTDSLGADPIATTNTSSTITVTHASHGLSVGDEIIFVDAQAVGGISANTLNSIHTIATVPTSGTYTITLPDSATSTTSGGGSAIVVKKPNYLYSHEVGHDADGEAMTAYITSADMDIGEGYKRWFVSRIIPDIQFRDSTDPNDAVTLDLYGHEYPGESVASLSSSSITPTTKQDHIRVSTRQVALRTQSTGTGYGWRLGHVRLDAREDGRR